VSQLRKEALLLHWLDSVVGDNSLSFVSLNYDTLLDSTLNKCLGEREPGDHGWSQQEHPGSYLKFGYGFEVYSEDGVLQTGNGMQLLKPHGSLNLIYCSRCNKIYWRSDSWYASMLNDRALCPFCKQNMDAPLQLPPAYTKDLSMLNLNDAVTVRIQQVKDKVVAAIAGADQIRVFGYSFPPYDYEFRYLCMKGLLLNRKRDQVVVDIVDYVEDESRAADQARKYNFLTLMIRDTTYHIQGFIRYLEDSVAEGKR